MSSLATHATFLGPDLLDPPPEPPPEPAAATDGGAPGSADTDPPDDADATAEPAEVAPPGARLAQALVDALATRGWRVLYRWPTPYGHAFDCTRAEARYDVELRLLDPDDARWLVWATPRAGLVSRLFKKRAAGDPVEHALLLAHLEEVLRADPRVSDLRWTTAADAPNPA